MGRIRKHEIVIGFLLATAIWATLSALQGNFHAGGQPTQVETRKPDEIVAEYTIYLAWFTGVLAFVSMVQGYFLYRADGTARINAFAAKEAANAATTSANLVLATERPYVFIQHMSGRTFHPAADMRDISSPYRRVLDYRELAKAIDTKCTIQNYGRNPALVRAISAQLNLTEDMAQTQLPSLTAIPPVIESGGRLAFDVPLGVAIDRELSEMIQDGRRSLWLHFAFVYRDILGNEHTTEGRWRYSFSKDNWTGDYDRAT